jgi:toxin FitB
MTDYLLDTNTLSEMRKSPERQNSQFRTTMGQIAASDLFVSDITLAEIRFGIEALPDTQERDVLLQWLKTIVRPSFSGRTLRADETTWVLMIRAMKIANTQRKTYQMLDLAIAMIAQHNGMTVITRDTEPFIRAGVPVLNPFA